MEKYYTPKIQEFYVGFEYEFAVIENGNDCWLPGDVIDVYVLTHIIQSEDYLKDLYRVKYLDREDIDSLGFAVAPDTMQPVSLSAAGFVRRVLYTKGNLSLTKFDNSPVVNIITDNQYLFQGEIKNKSELKVILRQIGL